MLVREYQARDAAAVWALHVEALSSVGALYPGPWDDDFKRIAEVYFNPGGTFLVGELDGSIVAMGALRWIDSVTAEIKRMRIRPHSIAAPAQFAPDPSPATKSMLRTLRDGGRLERMLPSIPSSKLG